VNVVLVFSPMANSVASALAGALLFSVTLVPVLASFAYTKPFHHRESPVLKPAAKLYLPTLSFSLRRPWLVLGLAVALLGATGVMGSWLGAALAALGLVPAAVSRAMGSGTQRPLSVVIVFGTLSACALTLVLFPLMYRLYAAGSKRTCPVTPSARSLSSRPRIERRRFSGSFIA
jgi:Cu/Ag efflux pump CusA